MNMKTIFSVAVALSLVAFVPAVSAEGGSESYVGSLTVPGVVSGSACPDEVDLCIGGASFTVSAGPTWGVTVSDDVLGDVDFRWALGTSGANDGLFLVCKDGEANGSAEFDHSDCEDHTDLAVWVHTPTTTGTITVAEA